VLVTEQVESAAATRCAWCGSALNGSSRRLPGRAVCAACGVATTDPWPSDEVLEEAYGDWYRPASGRFSGPGDTLLKRTRSWLARRLDRGAPDGPVLDVGAGEGVLLDALRRVGRRGLGLERHALRPDVRDADISEIDGEWAAIVFWHSLEHLRTPGASVSRAAELLAPGGLLVIATPNAGSLQARAFGDRWFGLDVPRHLVHLPAQALLARLRGEGLRIERVSYLRGGQIVFGWLHGLTGSLPGRPDLYDAIRRPDARREPVSASRRAGVLLAGALTLPLALVCSAVEVAVGRGGTVYVEARNG
jgi:SAM-dependent methyltransferase